MTTIADTIRAGISAGLTNEQVLADVRANHPDASTSKACVSYYRSQAKKSGSNPYRPGSMDHALREALSPKPATVGEESYDVTGVKTFIGMEGHGYNATLRREGKAIAFVIDDASGGCIDIQWNAAIELRAPGRELQLLQELVDRMPKHVCDFDDPATGGPCELEMTVELFIEHLVNRAEQEKQLRSMTKGKVAFMDGGKLFTVKSVPTEANIAAVRAKYPQATVLNGMPVEQALALAKDAK